MDIIELLGGKDEKSSPFDDYVPVIQSRDGRSTTIYLTEAISYPSEYNKACLSLESAVPGDNIIIKINNGGGSIDSAFQIIDAMKRCKGHIKVEISGSACSAATVITMYAHELYVADFASFMIHNYSTGMAGKGHELKSYQEHTDRELNAAFRTIYKGFLTDKEMTQVINGKDIWMGKDEVLARWNTKQCKIDTPSDLPITTKNVPSTPAVRRGRPRKSEV